MGGNFYALVVDLIFIRLWGHCTHTTNGECLRTSSEGGKLHSFGSQSQKVWVSRPRSGITLEFTKISGHGIYPSRFAQKLEERPSILLCCCADEKPWWYHKSFELGLCYCRKEGDSMEVCLRMLFKDDYPSSPQNVNLSLHCFIWMCIHQESIRALCFSILEENKD